MIQVINARKSFLIEPLFTDVSFVISGNTKVGIVGPNGVGKSTLLKIILGEEVPDKGEVVCVQEVVTQLPQHIPFKHHETLLDYLMKHLEFDWEEYKIDMALAEVGLTEIDKSIEGSKLSGGQKIRVGLAAVLMKEPTFLILDEPTNNLDMETILWLEKFIKHFSGGVLMVSHDRTFLDNVVDRIFEIDIFTHKLEEYSGGYTDYVIEKQNRYDKNMMSFKRFEKKRLHMEDWIHTKQQQLSVHVNPKVARQLKAMKTRYVREIAKERVEKPKEFKTFSIDTIGDKLHARRGMFTALNVIFPNVVACESLFIFGGDRIQLKGANGSGKTTLIKMLLGLIDGYYGKVKMEMGVKVGYFSQDHDILNQNHTVLEEFTTKSDISDEYYARGVLGHYLFPDQRIYNLIKQLSYGERVRLMLAILTHQNNNFLILDEPTNHLDLPSREILEQALAEYDGGFIVVSHDRYFVRKIKTNRVLEIVEGCVVDRPK